MTAPYVKTVTLPPPEETEIQRIHEPWTQQEELYLRTYYHPPYTARSIATRLNKSIDSVHNKARRIGLTYHATKKLDLTDAP